MSEFDPPTESARQGPLIRLVHDQRVAFLIVGAINTSRRVRDLRRLLGDRGPLCRPPVRHIAGTLVTIGIAHPLGVLFAFVMYRRFVFRVRGHVLRDLVRFWSVYLTRVGINIVVLPVLVELGLHRIPAQAIILVCSTLLSYFGHRHFSFRRGAADTQDKTSRRRACSRHRRL